MTPRPWWWRLLLRHPRDSIAVVVMVGAALAVIVNGAYLQHGHHPAPMFAIKPLPVVSSDTTAAVLPRPRPAEPEVAKRDLAPAAPVRTADNAIVAGNPKAHPPVPLPLPGPRRDAIAELLAGHSAHPVPPAPVAAPAAAPPAAVAPQRAAGAPSRQVLAVPALRCAEQQAGWPAQSDRRLRSRDQGRDPALRARSQAADHRR